MKKELLSPAGNMEALKQAVIHGADAVYVGGKSFGARAFAPNFSYDELKEAIFYCHLYGVKLYVTVNTMIYESELDQVLEYVKFLYENHVDAIIMADLGLMSLCHECFPKLEIHASTQAHTHNLEQLKLLERLGVKRVVLARELSLEEIKKFPDSMEYEVFIHGALCISYSGQCLFSSLLMNRSGNRGSCAQICRLPFTLLENKKRITTDGNYLLSTKDLNTTYRIAELMESNIKSFKIEGRMKSPAYVGYITKMYRTLMDQYEQKKEAKVTQSMVKNASVLFGREFTEGKLFSKTGKDFINQHTSNHQGILLGKVKNITKQKIEILLEEDLHQEDGIRFLEEEKGMIVNFLYDQNELLISSAKKGDTIFLDNKIDLKKKCLVLKTIDVSLEKQILSEPEKKIPISIQAKVSIQNGFTLLFSDGENEVFYTEKIVEPAKNYPITKEKIASQIAKLGNTPFWAKEVSIEMEDNIFISVQKMNELRRALVEELIHKRTYRTSPVILGKRAQNFSYDSTLEIYATVRNEEQLKTLLHLSVAGIYVEDYSLYQKYKNNEKVIFRTNRVLHQVKSYDVSRVLVGESGSLMVYQVPKSTDYFFNVSNHATANVLLHAGANRICLSPEMNFDEMKLLLKEYPNGNPFEFILYGRLEVMILNHCILECNVKHNLICDVCKRNNRYALEDRNGKIYPLLFDEFHHTHIFHFEKKDEINRLSLYYQLGIRKFRLEFFDETPNEIKNIVLDIKNILHV